MFASFKIAAIAAASATLALGAGVASAEDFVSNGRTMEVRHGDLDLSKADQQAVLRSRIARAASRVCIGTDLAAYTACRSKAIAHVQPGMKAAIARADSGERYAEARPVETRAVVGN
jgi:UrcA family protein